MNTFEYSQYIRANLDRDKFASLIASLGNQLNDRKSRFDKSDLIEQSFEIYSDGKFKWVDEKGRDHRDFKNSKDLEMKFQQDCLFSLKNKQLKKIVRVKIKNFLGENKGINIPDPADFFIFAQQDAMAVVSYDDLHPFLIATNSSGKSLDGIYAAIPPEKLSFVFYPNEVDIVIRDIDYKMSKLNAQRELIKSFYDTI